MSRDAASLSGYWQRRIFNLACRLNFGWWLDRFLFLFFILSMVCMCALLLARREGWSEVRVWEGFGVAFAAIVLGAFFWARKRFENKTSARVRLEYALGLNNRLTASASGVGPWPEPPGEWPEILRWRWRAVLGMGLAGLGLLLAGAFIPVDRAEDRVSNWAAKPPVLEQLESWIETLEQNQLVDEKALEELKQEVEQLSNSSPEEWYSHPNLEAADHLRGQLQNMLKALQQDLKMASGALEKMGQENPALSESQMTKLSNQLADALKAAHGGQLPLDAKFMENLPEIDPSKLKALTPEQAKELMGRLKKADGGLKKFQAGEGEGDPVMALLMMEQEMGGTGGVERGPGSVPLTLSPHPSEVGSTKVEGVSNEDMERASLGETVGISKGEYDTPVEYGGAVAGGSAEQGTGGEAVWVNRLTPAEQAQVKSFFK